MPKSGKSVKRVHKKREKVLLPKHKQLEAEQQLANRKEANPDVYNLPASKRSIQDLTAYFEAVEEGTNVILPKETDSDIHFQVDIIGSAASKAVQESIYDACNQAETIQFENGYNGVIYP